MNITRREFLASGAAAAVPLSAAAVGPVSRPGKPHMKLSLAAYSFNRQLGRGGKKGSMTMTDFIDFAGRLPLDAVEPTSYYFPSTSRPYLTALKQRCTRLGLDVSGSAVGNDFCAADPAKVKQQVAGVKAWVERVSLLGGKTIRVFAGKLPKGADLAATRRRCVAALEEACEHAGRFGVYLALENHGGITASADGLLALVEAVKSPHFGVNLDTGNFRTADPYGDLAKLAPYAVTVQVKEYVQPAGQKKRDADMPRLVNMLRDVGYRGYVVMEYEGPNPATAVPKYVEELRRLVDER